jgi:uncharacterized membrane protein (UPF0127 family)
VIIMKIVKHPLRKMIGLMFQRPKDFMMVWDKDVQYPVHTWFCFVPLKISFLDKNKKTVDSTILCPFKTYRPKKPYRYILETSV